MSAAHQSPVAAYVAGDLAGADPAATAADVAGYPAYAAATEDAPQVYGALKSYNSHKRWWFHDMATNERVLTIYGLAGLKGQRHNHINCQCWLSEMCQRRGRGSCGAALGRFGYVG